MKRSILACFLLFVMLGMTACDKEANVGETGPGETESSRIPIGTMTPALTEAGECDTTPMVMPTPTATLAPTALPEPTATPVPTPTPSVVTFYMTGDLMCLGGQQNAAALKGGGYDFTPSFAFIKDQLADSDFVIGNLETLICPSFPYTAQMKYVEEDCPNCNGPAEFLDAVKDAGFDVLFTCNNHSLDAGITGINETIEYLDSYGFFHTGTYKGTEESSGKTADEVVLTENDATQREEGVAEPGKGSERFLIIEKNGIKIGLVAFTELINLRESLPKEELEQVINCYGKSYAIRLIEEAKAAGADFVIAYNHWGSENTHEVREYQKSHAKVFAEAGADLIIGTHPHCLQGWELILTEDGREVPCYYSLGNLVSSMLREINDDTVLIKFTLRRVEDRVVIENTEYTACHVMDSLNGKSHVIVPVSYPLEKESQRAELQEAEERILQVLQLEQ